MEQSKIHISTHKDGLHEKPCEFFKVNRYFSELTTDVDKARARYNLGIPDEFSLTWEAIAGKPNIDSLLNDQKSRIVSSYHLDTLAYDLQTIRSNVLELQNITQGLTSAKLLEVEKLWSDVARNSRDILALQGGGDTSLGTRLTAVETSLSSALERIRALENGGSGSTYDDTELRTRIGSLESRVTTLENNQPDMNSILVRLNAIEAQLQTDTITDIRIGTGASTLEVTDSAGNQTVEVYAIHSKIEPVVITNLVTVNTNNAAVAYWDTTLHQIVINSAGTATLTFTYDSFIKTLTVNVSSSAQPQIETTYYIGYAPFEAITTANQFVGNSDFAITNITGTIAKTGEELFKYSGVDLLDGRLAADTYLFFCCPSNRTLNTWNEISAGNSQSVQFLRYNAGVVLGNETYKVYYLSPATYNDLSYQFIIE